MRSLFEKVADCNEVRDCYFLPDTFFRWGRTQALIHLLAFQGVRDIEVGTSVRMYDGLEEDQRQKIGLSAETRSQCLSILVAGVMTLEGAGKTWRYSSDTASRVVPSGNPSNDL